MSKRTTPPVTPADLADLPPLVSIAQMAAVMGFSRSKGYRYAAAGHWPTVSYGDRKYVVVAKVRAALEAS